MIRETAKKLGIEPFEVFVIASTGHKDRNAQLAFEYWSLHGETPLWIVNFCRKVLYEPREEVLLRTPDGD